MNSIEIRWNPGRFTQFSVEYSTVSGPSYQWSGGFVVAGYSAIVDGGLADVQAIRVVPIEGGLLREDLEWIVDSGDFVWVASSIPNAPAALVVDFTGRSLVVTWAAQDGADEYDWEVYDTDTLTLQNSGSVTGTRLEYSFEQAIVDGGPWRDLTVKVRSVNAGSQVSGWTTDDFQNAAPTAPTATATATTEGVVIDIPICLDADVLGYKVWGSTSNGFTPNDGTNLLYRGPSNRVNLTGLTVGTPYYFKAAVYDVWGESDANISAQVTATPTAASTSFTALMVNGVSKLGDGGSTNYAQFSSTGFLTLLGSATVWDDFVVPLVGIRANGSRIAEDLTEGTTTFANNCTSSDWAIFATQMPHKWKLGSIIYPHLHWFQPNGNLPNWMIQYRWQINGASKTTSWTSLKRNSEVFNYSSGDLVQITIFGASGISPPGGASLSDVLQFRLIRDQNNSSGLFSGSDTTGVVVHGLSFDFHYEADRLGTDTEYS